MFNNHLINTQLWLEATVIFFGGPIGPFASMRNTNSTINFVIRNSLEK